MLQMVSVTSKGQMTLPKEFRDRYKIKTRHRAIVETAEDFIKVYAAPDIFELAGKFKAPKGMDALKARRYMETHYKRV